MPAWNVNIQKSGKVTAETAGRYVDRNIEITVPDGSAAVASGQTIVLTPTIRYDSATGKIVASCSGSKAISATVTKEGWIASVESAQVSASGSVSADPEDILPITSVSELKTYLGI